MPFRQPLSYSFLVIPGYQALLKAPFTSKNKTKVNKYLFSLFSTKVTISSIASIVLLPLQEQNYRGVFFARCVCKEKLDEA